MLAFYMPYEYEDQTITYTREELSDPATVKTLFDHCQILEGYITYSGWLFLIKQYWYDKLYEIDKSSGWFDSPSLEQFICDVDLEMQLAKDTEYDTCCRDTIWMALLKYQN